MSAANVAKVGSGILTSVVEDANEKPAKNSGAKAKRPLIPVQERSPSSCIMEGMYNLVCHAGHRWFAPTPDEWKGHKCYYPSGRKECEFPLHRIK